LRLQLKLAKLLQQKREYDRLEQHLQNLRQLLMADQREDPLKASQLTEVLALEITMHTERGNIRKLKVNLFCDTCFLPLPATLTSAKGIVRESKERQVGN